MKQKELLEKTLATEYSESLKVKIFRTALNEEEADMVAKLMDKNLSEEEMNREIDKLREKLGRKKI